MKSIRKYISVAFVLSLSIALAGQTRTSYFVDNATLRHNYNAAFAPDQGYVGFPLLSNINFNTASNMGLSTFYYPLNNGKLGLFLNEEIKTADFINSIDDVSYLDANLNFDIVNAGWFWKNDSFWTLDIGVHSDITSTLPKELFRFAKEGMTTTAQNYLIEQTSVGANLYGQAAIGYSQGLDKWVKGLRVGGKFKLLFGLQDFSAKIDRMSIQLSEDQWTAISTGSGHVYGGGIVFGKNENGTIDSVSFAPSDFALSGMGAAIDLGVEYRISEGTPVDGLTFSLSVVDLGFISYFKNKSSNLKNSGANQFSYNGFQDIDFHEFDFSDDLEQLGTDFLNAVSFEEEKVDGNQLQTLTAKVYAGVEYPFCKNQMSVGLLYSGRFGKFRNEHELTLAYNYAPVRWFDVAVSYSFLNSRQSIGWLLTFVPRNGLNVFIGSDYTAIKYSPQGIPINKAYLDINFGISVPMGGTNKRQLPGRATY